MGQRRPVNLKNTTTGELRQGKLSLIRMLLLLVVVVVVVVVVM